MNTKRFLEKIADNWPSKIICFILALLIYFFHQMSVLDRRTFTVPLTINANGSMIPASETEHRVKITIRGKNSELASVTDKDLTAYLDITDITKEGRYKFPVLIKTDSRLMFMEPFEIKVNPEEIPLDVEERVFKYVPLSPTINGEVAHGYEITSVSVLPKTIRVEGPRSMVTSISAIQTDGVAVDGLMQDTILEVLPVNENKLLSLDTKESLSVSVSIKESVMKRDFTDVSITLINLPDELEVKNFSGKVTVTVQGSVNSLENLDARYVAPLVDCAKLTVPGIYELPVVISLPDGMIVVTKSVQKVSFTVTEKQNAAHGDKKAADSVNGFVPDGVLFAD